MAGVERGIEIRGLEDVQKIPGHCEREFARLLLNRDRPDLSIVYEPDLFENHNGGKIEGTVPDFRITTTTTGRVIYVEITLADKNGEKDYKERQKRVMSEQQGVLFVVLYGDNLRNIQAKHPEYDFFNSSRKRRTQRK